LVDLFVPHGGNQQICYTFDFMEYLHGYTEEERNRLTQQASMLQGMIYEYLDLSEHTNMLEIGCGTGGQSKILLETYPALKLTSLDREEEQIKQANENMSLYPSINNRVTFGVADAEKIPFPDNSFDASFIVWVLEHASDPLAILKESYAKLQPGGKIYITEVYNQSLNIQPEAPYTVEYWRHFNETQSAFGGNPNVGIELGRLLSESGFLNIKTRNLNRHFDKRNIEQRNAMFDFFLKLMFSAKGGMITSGRIDVALCKQVENEFEKLKQNSESIFYYCPIQAVGEKQLI